MKSHTKLILAVVAAFIAFAAYKTYAAPTTCNVGVECNAESLTIHLPSPQAWVSIKWSDVARACRSGEK